jgi:hypothetical protein
MEATMNLTIIAIIAILIILIFHKRHTWHRQQRSWLQQNMNNLGPILQIIAGFALV